MHETTPQQPRGGWPIPRAAYIHVPFCRHRCGYCNFSVVTGRDDLADSFLSAIDQELAALNRPSVDSVFIGGGTPTHLSFDQLKVLLQIVNERLQLNNDCELSVEVNPEDVDASILSLMVESGVNRLSLGVQSFDDQKLQTLERHHTGQQAIDAIHLAAQWIPNISADLIFAAPGERLTTWQQDLITVFSLPLTHLSTYTLTFEKGTSFWSQRYHGNLQGADEDEEIAMYQLVCQRAAEQDWQHYEISNFSFSHHACQHNLAYWQGRGWFAAGPGAARFVGGRREVNHRSPTTYLKRMRDGQSPTAESESISVSQFARERVAFGLRRIDGIDVQQLSDEIGLSVIDLCGPAIQSAIDQGLLIGQESRVKLTTRGILFADSVAASMLS